MIDGTCGNTNESLMAGRKAKDLRLGWAMLYLALSMASGFLELGVLLLASRGTSAFVKVPLFALAYQLGAVLCHPVRMPITIYLLAGLAGSACACLATHPTITMSISILGVSIALQFVRDIAGKHCHVTTIWKRVARVCGFVAAPWLTSWGLCGAGLVTTVLVTLPRCWNCNDGKVARNTWPVVNLVGVTMLVHQSHYFIYSCFLPLVFLRTHGIALSWVGAAFASGWVSYCCAPWLFRQWPPAYVFVAGHVTASASLMVLALFVTCPRVVLATWFFSGFGGGTVFCLRELERRRLPALEGNLDSWENLGHLCGILAGFFIIVVLPQLESPFVLAAATAAGTAVLGAALMRSKQSDRPAGNVTR